MSRWSSSCSPSNLAAANVLRKAARLAQVCGCLPSMLAARMEGCIPASAGSSPGCCRHLRSESVVGMPLTFSLPLFVTLPFKELTFFFLKKQLFKTSFLFCLDCVDQGSITFKNTEDGTQWACSMEGHTGKMLSRASQKTRYATYFIKLFFITTRAERYQWNNITIDFMDFNLRVSRNNINTFMMNIFLYKILTASLNIFIRLNYLRYNCQVLELKLHGINSQVNFPKIWKLNRLKNLSLSRSKHLQIRQPQPGCLGLSPTISSCLCLSANAEAGRRGRGLS